MNLLTITKIVTYITRILFYIFWSFFFFFTEKVSYNSRSYPIAVCKGQASLELVSSLALVWKELESQVGTYTPGDSMSF